MIAEMLILVPLAFKKGGGNDVGSTYGVTQTEGSTANLGAGNWFKLGKIETCRLHTSYVADEPERGDHVRRLVIKHRHHQPNNKPTRRITIHLNAP